MTRYSGGEKVKPGTYVNLGTGQFISVDEHLPMLPLAKAKYARIPVGLVFILGPIGGLAYIIFLPLAGIVSLVAYTGYKLRALFSPLSTKQVKQ